MDSASSSSYTASDLFLDPAIRDWVVLPLFLIMVTAGLLRGIVGQYLAGPYEKTKAVASVRQDQLAHLQKIKSGASHYISTTRWHIRRLFVLQQMTHYGDQCIQMHTAKKDGQNTAEDDPMSSMMNNPMGMLQGNMVFMVQNMVMMQGIQHFFSGFIMLKIPFSLTAGFKTMFQKGLADAMPDLDPSYVSSISWYFLTMYGLRGFFKLVMGGEPVLEAREQETTLARMGLAPPNPNPQVKAKQNDSEEWARKFQKEAENLELFLSTHQSEFDSVEKRLLGTKYPKRRSAAASASKDGKSVNNTDFLLGKVSSSKRKNQ
mmetsp:Transcript_3206/g.4313  ORF Transcript_3206/g.4313 Transcript_3206/m.4313 type:complete len:318 (+) Transcript_3206:138-1091(+)|eukprot:CAMPEP_0198149156 /NCGR_PEP_ID=MMETSP1443-20131203/45158_1 /TAXON_ID=186043 /ORGANISM="Entomoneis sp., Strain CCMP2396" /LENGTH=317 /DNA_ID=CAMNT_0043814085 /DNA_START=85 /DNA_END=1038 /DNA_ORIENTATION=-